MDSGSQVSAGSSVSSLPTHQQLRSHALYHIIGTPPDTSEDTGASGMRHFLSASQLHPPPPVPLAPISLLQIYQVGGLVPPTACLPGLWLGRELPAFQCLYSAFLSASHPSPLPTPLLFLRAPPISPMSDEDPFEPPVGYVPQEERTSQSFPNPMPHPPKSCPVLE